MSRVLNFSLARGTELGPGPYSNPAFGLFASPDITYIVNVVISLIALFFAFDAVCGERENGTLKLILVNSVPRDSLLLGKWIGGFAVLSAPLVLGFVAGIVVSLVLTKVSFSWEALLRLAAVGGTSLLYVAVFFSLGLLLSTSSAKSSTSLILCLFIWVIWVLAVPNIVPILARYMAGSPSRGALSGERQAIEQDIWPAVRRKMDDVKDEKERNQLWTEAAEEVQRKWELALSEYQRRVYRQAALAQVMSRISPSASYVYATTSLAATGVEDYKLFDGYLQTFKDEYDRSVNALIAGSEGSSRSSSGSSRSSGGFDVSQLPEFDYQSSPPGKSVQRSMLDFGLLAVWNILFFLGAFLKFARYEA